MDATNENNGRLPKRHELPAEYKWRLEDMFATDAAWEAEFNAIKELLGEVDQYRGNLGKNAETLLRCLQLQDTIYEKLGRVYAYARMRKDEDNTNPLYQELHGRTLTLDVQASSALAFMNPEILAIPGETLEQFMQHPELKVYKHALSDLLRQKPHVLPQAEEELLARFSEITQAPAQIFSMLNDADIRFPKITDENGVEIELTKARFTRLMESKDRRVRQDAFQGLYSSYIAQRHTIGATLSSSIRKDCVYAGVRHYNSALESALDADNMPMAVYDNLISAVRSHVPLMSRYVELRKRMLGVDELHMYDLYVPLIPEADIRMSYEEAKETVAEAMAPLGDEYVTQLKRGLNSSWIDVYENEGKTSGAYSWGVYGTHPFVLLNWQDTLDNVFTLAHEMGHAMHSYFSTSAQPFVYYQSSIFLAEIASTLNENLLTQYLLEKLTDKHQKMYLINHHLDQFRGTVYRQTMFAEFEKIIHAKVEAGEPLTADNLSQIYRQLVYDYFGDGIVIDPEIEMEWARIPHFYRPFYVYKYATGYSAATTLCKQINEQGKPAVERYLRFLASGSSDYPLNILKAAGVDMTRPEPVRQALEVFGSLLDELEAML
ncbi:MAG TPA: oligoendopeptidase F [Firmicutes bacterium]|nr:oligoendopeptidase F [Bacillota bacterium]